MIGVLILVRETDTRTRLLGVHFMTTGIVAFYVLLLAYSMVLNILHVGAYAPATPNPGPWWFREMPEGFRWRRALVMTTVAMVFAAFLVLVWSQSESRVPSIAGLAALGAIVLVSRVLRR